ncbi:hypothetical protein [Micropruina sp.]|uniref:hypothetical protein n=1 Tax=Micropruina sp. TaxID=2737536 RepID=UPI0039E2A9C5
MSDADLVAALHFALTGSRYAGGGGDLPAVLVDEGWDASALRAHADAVIAANRVWPHPVPDDLRQRVGSAQLFAAVQRTQRELGLFGQVAAPAAARGLDADERRLMADVPPHHGV